MHTRACSVRKDSVFESFSHIRVDRQIQSETARCGRRFSSNMEKKMFVVKYNRIRGAKRTQMFVSNRKKKYDVHAIFQRLLTSIQGAHLFRGHMPGSLGCPLNGLPSPMFMPI